MIAVVAAITSLAVLVLVLFIVGEGLPLMSAANMHCDCGHSHPSDAHCQVW